MIWFHLCDDKLHIPQIQRANSDKSKKNTQRSSILEAELARAQQLLADDRHFDYVDANDTLRTEDDAKVGITCSVIICLTLPLPMKNNYSHVNQRNFTK
jgi:hypothetical protein